MMKDPLTHRGLLGLEGVLLFILGLIAVILPIVFLESISLLLGCLFLIGGVFQFYRLVKSYPFSGFLSAAVIASFYILSAILILVFPKAGMSYFTFLLAAFFFVVGMFKVFHALQLNPIPGWGLFLLSGILSIVFAIVIWSGFPNVPTWLLGLLAGINMMTYGSSLIVLSLNKTLG